MSGPVLPDMETPPPPRWMIRLAGLFLGLAVLLATLGLIQLNAEAAPAPQSGLVYLAAAPIVGKQCATCKGPINTDGTCSSCDHYGRR